MQFMSSSGGACDPTQVTSSESRFKEIVDRYSMILVNGAMAIPMKATPALSNAFPISRNLVSTRMIILKRTMVYTLIMIVECYM